MLFTATVTVYCENHTKTLCKMLSVVIKSGAVYNSQCALKF